MNRLILIGNGFDLAHGLKTSYADFIEWYWEQWGKRLIKEITDFLSDGLCSFKLHTTQYYSTWYHYWLQHRNPIIQWNFHEVAENERLCDFSYKSLFFEEICQSVENRGWVDIENIYYSYLCKDDIDPKLLNEQLAIIRTKLIEYLTEVQKNVTNNVIKGEIRSKMIAPFCENDIAVGSKKEYGKMRITSPNICPDRTLLLNFNYTDCADYYKHCLTIPSNVDIRKFDFHCPTIHIHGELPDESSVIFGYGDELDEKYKTIVSKNENEYLRNVKSVKYLEHANYRNMLEFIESAPFQIFIMGHSCGNSDRTLLNTLFEHRNCVSIKPFYYIKDDGSDNYIELVQNISRNFTDMKLMRDRVVNKEFCEPLLNP